MGPESTEVVRGYLEAIVRHDWEAVGGYLADDVVRRGPFGDDIEGRAPYVAFLKEVLPALPGYSMEVHRIRSAGPAVVLAELAETIDGGPGAEPITTPEALVFDLDDDGAQITRVAVYLRRLNHT